MLDKRLPMLCAFAGGCLSTALFLANWHPEPTPVRRAPVASAFERGPGEVASVKAREHAVRADDSADDASANEDEPAPASTSNRRREPEASAEGATAKNGDAPDASTDQGSSVADVLTRLEAAYRKNLPTTADGTPSGAGNEVASLGDDVATPVIEHAPSVPAAAVLPAATPLTTTAVADAPAREVAAQEPTVVLATPVALTRGAAPVPVSAPSPVAAAPADAPLVGASDINARDVAALPADIAQGLAQRDTSQPRNVYLGNVQNNVYLGNVYQGDVYQVQQQLELLEYMQLLSASPYGRIGGRVPRGFARSAPVSRPLSASAPSILPPPAPGGTFTSDLTNPDNPWGFNFPPTMLVK